MIDKLYKLKEVQEKFGVSRRTLIYYEEQGLIRPARTPGGHRRYPESELLKLFQRESNANDTDNDPRNTD